MPAPSTQSPPSMTAVVGRGVSWMLVASLVGKLSSLIAQVVLGWLLFDDDFGVYAIALAITVVFQVFRDGGARKILMQRGRAGFARLATPVLYVSFVFNFATAVSLWLLAPFAARAYAEPDLQPMLVIIGVGAVLSTMPGLYMAELSVSLRHRELSRITSTSAVFRQVTIVLGVLAGLGPVAFAVPFVLCPLLEHAMCRAVCAPLRIGRRPRLRVWRVLLGTSGWLMVGAGALAFVRQGFSAVLGAFHSTELLGVFFFGYQVVLQINVLIATNLQPVLLPVLASLKGNAGRHALAVNRCVGAVGLLSSVAATGLIVVAPDLERLIWNGKWAGSVPVIQWLAAFFPVRMSQSVIEPALLSKGLNRYWAGLMIVQAAIVLALAAVAGLLGRTPGELGALMGVGLALGSGVGGVLALRRLSMPAWPAARSFCVPWLVTLACGGAVLLGREAVGVGGAGRVGALVSAGACGFAYAVLVVAAVMLFLRRHVEDALRALPARLTTRFGRLLPKRPGAQVAAEDVLEP